MVVACIDRKEHADAFRDFGVHLMCVAERDKKQHIAISLSRLKRDL